MARNIEATQIVNGVLKSLVVAGMAGCLVVAPNAVQLGEIALKRLNKNSRMRNAKSLVNYLAKQELVKVKELPDGQLQVTITKRGQKRVQKVEFADLKVSKLRQWDRRWRILTFDIPEKQRTARRSLSLKLRDLGFYQLQRSVWVHAYPCSVELELVRQTFGIGNKYVTLFESDYLNREQELKRFFGL